MSQERKRVRGVLLWLRDLAKWVSEDPVNRYQAAMDQLNRNAGVVKEAIEEVIEPEFREFVPIVAGLIQAGDVEEASKGEEGQGDKGDNEEVRGGGEEGQVNGPDQVQRVAED